MFMRSNEEWYGGHVENEQGRTGGGLRGLQIAKFEQTYFSDDPFFHNSALVTIQISTKG